MKRISVYVHGNYAENKEPTYNYRNNQTDTTHERISKEKVLELTQKDVDQGLLISYPSELQLSTILKRTE
ncbi:hypothetical protein CN918_29225 [Priestia megaterium]|nr:hypothetical protein CN918_29225 [Priestia megaterium]